MNAVTIDLTSTSGLMLLLTLIRGWRSHRRGATTEEAACRGRYGVTRLLVLLLSCPTLER